MSDPNLVTTCDFNNRTYFVKMHVTNNVLELVITDKQTAEDWQCCYDASYIENITQKTGNFKQFNIFTAMLKSGLLKTSNSVYLDLMTFDDLDALRNHRNRGPYSIYHSTQLNSNKRYLILTYTVEFDRIHYPLPLEYCGPPDPKILQQNIIKLEQEVVQLKEQIKGGKNNIHDTRTIISLQKRIDDLTKDNSQLKTETIRLSNLLDKKSKNKDVYMLQNAIKNLEQSVLSERKSHHKLVEKLHRDKMVLSRELERLKHSEKELLNRLYMKEKRTFKRGAEPGIKFESRSPSPRGIRSDSWETQRTIKPKRTFKKISDPGPKVESRSPSPRDIRSESWETRRTTKPKRMVRSARTKLRHKSTSGSESDREFNCVKLYPSYKTSNTKITSRPNSTSSRSSSGSRTSRKRRQDTEVTPRGMQSKTSVDFAPLANRVSNLQKLLHTGLHIT